MGESERKMLSGVGVDLFIFYRNNTAGMAERGFMVPGHPGVVGRNLAAGG